jgi:hypothetical protein
MVEIIAHQEVAGANPAGRTKKKPPGHHAGRSFKVIANKN